MNQLIKEMRERKVGVEERTLFSDALRRIKIVKGIKGAIISSSIGFPFAFDLEQGRDPVEIAGIGSTLQNAVLEASTSMNLSRPEFSIVSFKDDIFMIFNINTAFNLLAIAEKRTDINQTVKSIRKVVERINAVLGG